MTMARMPRARGACQRVAVIAGGMRDHHRRACRVELQQHVHGAAILEGTAGLQVLAFEEHLASDPRVESRGTHDRRAHHVRADAPRRGDDVGERRHVCW
jgi:hypothetical protein